LFLAEAVVEEGLYCFQRFARVEAFTADFELSEPTSPLMASI
jgi:hypothetical protein